MQREREARDSGFDMREPFGGFGWSRSMMPSLFGSRDPFADPFFSRPFGSMFESTPFGPSAGSDVARQTDRKGIVIEELNSDDEEMEDVCEGNGKNNNHNEPSVEHADDIAEEMKNKDVYQRSDYTKTRGTPSQTQMFGVHTSRVTYGGVDGAYYTTTRTRKTGSDGTTLEETREADKTTGEATHRISRGIHDKGHSLTRRLNSDGKVDTLQTLHNLNKDELAGFEEAWNGNAKGHFPGWDDKFDMHNNAGTSSNKHMRNSIFGDKMLTAREPEVTAFGPNNNAGASSSSGRTKKVVRINIE